MEKESDPIINERPKREDQVYTGRRGKGTDQEVTEHPGEDRFVTEQIVT